MDLTVIAIPGFFGSMAYESKWLQRRAEVEGPSPVDYERNDTIASLAMGTGSLVIPLLTSRLSRNFELGKGRWAKHAARGRARRSCGDRRGRRRRALRRARGRIARARRHRVRRTG